MTQKDRTYLQNCCSTSSDQEIDDFLGINPKVYEKTIDKRSLSQKFGFEQYTYEATPYKMIDFFLNFLSPQEKDVVYDLGAGYGRILLYGAATHKATFKGIEIVPERVTEIDRLIKSLELKNARIINDNVIQQDISDGTIYFLFNPFYPKTLEMVGDQLRLSASTKRIKIATWGGPSNEFFEQQNWLKLLPHQKSESDLDKISFFISI